jgi:hypothetical protein
LGIKQCEGLENSSLLELDIAGGEKGISYPLLHILDLILLSFLL